MPHRGARARDAVAAARRGDRPPPWWLTAGAGLCAGAAGVAVMTAAEKLEQAATGRVNSHVPRTTLQALRGDRLVQVLPLSRRRRFLLNHAMH